MVYFNKGCKFVLEVAHSLGVPIGTLPAKYLGLPLSKNYPATRLFSPLIDKVRARIESWNLQSLSIAGRAELIKSVLQNMISYWIFSFKLPVAIIEELERMFSIFLWHQKMHSWKWVCICRPKEEGGLGIRKLSSLWYQACLENVHFFILWENWMKTHYLKDAHIAEILSTLLDSGT